MPRGVYSRKKARVNPDGSAYVVPTEDDEQTRFVVWLRKNNVLHYAIPNGGRRSLLEGVKLKRAGVVAGVPDLCIPMPRGAYHGLYIELKRTKGGTVSEEQRYWIEALFAQGYFSQVCKGADAAIELTLRYMDFGGGNDNKPVLFRMGEGNFDGELPVF